MKLTRFFAGASAAALGAGLFAGVVPAQAAGDTPLAEVVVDQNKFDRNGKDFDVLAEAVLAVLDAKPDSTVSVLTDGDVRLTAFAPTDRAFKDLASALSGKKVKSEKKAFKTVAGLGIDTVEEVLLYHVVPGTTITAKKALKANGAKLKTAQGKTIKVKVKKKGHSASIILKDKAPKLANPMVVGTDINKGNKQIAHAIDGVLLPFAP